jgi:acetylornithine deacetylase/succinyl-diaminopimelate desuccinylase-like protein
VLCAPERPDVSRAGEVTVSVSPLPPDELEHEPLTSPHLIGLLRRIHAATRWLHDELRAEVARGFEPPWSTVNNGLLRLAPGRVDYVVDVRRVPIGSASAGRPGAVLDDYERRLGEGCTESGCTDDVRRLLESPPFLAAADSTALSALAETLRSLGLPTEPELKSGTTEASVYRGAGMDVVAFGPGEATGNIHRPNERVPVAQLEAAVDVYTGVVARLCGASAGAS